jgi:PAS domain S-box-containing protein
MQAASLPTPSIENGPVKAGQPRPADRAAPAPGPAMATTPIALLAELGRRAASAEEPRTLLQDAARAAANVLSASHYGVCQMHPTGEALSAIVWEVSATAQAATGPRRTYKIATSAADALAAQALREGRTLAVANLGQSLHRDAELQRQGITAAVVVPLLAGGTAYGTLNVLHKTPREFPADQVALLEAVAHIVTTALLRCRAEVRLAREERFTQSLRNSMEALLLVLSPDGKIADVNRACCETSGFTSEELIGRSISSALMLTEEYEIIKRALARIHAGQASEHFDSYILTKEGQRRRVSWSVAPLEGDEPGEGSIIASGVDITDRCEAVERSVRAEALAQDARRLAAELKQRIAAGEQSMVQPEIAGRLPQGVDYDRRARPRRKYPYLQLIAPLRGEQLPPDTEFQEQHCYDISSRGFAFLLPQPPPYEKVVVAFGAAPSVVYLTADVRHSTLREIDGKPQYVIGCRYTGRLNREA